MPAPIDDIVRHSAERLSDLHPDLLAHVEARLNDTKPPPTYLEPALAIALAGLVVNVAKFAWDIWRELQKDEIHPAPKVVARRVRLKIELPEGVSEAQRDRVIAVVVDEFAQGEKA